MTETIKKIADRVVLGHDTDWAMDIEHFDWVPGVGLYGIYHAYLATKDEKYLDFLKDWAGKHLSEAYDQKTVNSTAPMLTMLQLYKETGEEKYLKVSKEIGDWVLNEAPRTVDGGLEHTVTEANAAFGDQVWADTLFMVCIFMAKLGAVTKNQTYTDFATEQLAIHHRLLSDKAGLYYHGYNGAKGDHMSAIRWARANAWVIYATMEILNTVGDFAGRDAIEDYVKAHVSALYTVQDEDGGFHTILDDPGAYVEISATAGLAAGAHLAAKAGLNTEMAETIFNRGVKAVVAAVEEDGSVAGVSGGTPVMPDAQAYRDVPIMPTLYGQGLSIVALAMCV